MRFIYHKFKGAKTVYYLNYPLVLDIETSHNHNEENPICWITSIQVKLQDDVKIFRKPSDLMEYLKGLYEYYELDSFKRLMIIVHNLSFDISYLMPYLQCSFPYGLDEISLINKGHKVTCYRQGGLEFRDTYALVNKSLASWGKSMNVEHLKQEGLYDYEKIIYQDDELTADEVLYDTHDILCLDECFKRQLNIEGDTIASIPFTSTGYNRRRFRSSATKNKSYMNTFKAGRIDERQFHNILYSFAGGYTHNNRHLRDKIVVADIGHNDFRSHYPTQLRVSPLPFGPVFWLYDPINHTRDHHKRWTIEGILNLWPEYSSITTLWIEKAILKDNKISMPFMQFAKMHNISEGSVYTLDNGRIISFSGGCLMYVDNYLLKILSEQYNIKGKIIEILASKNSFCPSVLADTIDYYFKGKSDEKLRLKDIITDFGEFSDAAFEQRNILQHVKAGLNGCYGMFVQNPVYPEYDIDYNNEDRPLKDIFDPVINQHPDQYYLDKYYSNRNSFLPYIVGCFVTAAARYELYEYIATIGYENCLYCDTDSIFYINSPEVTERIEALNRKKHEQAEKLGAYITTSAGEKIYYDVFEQEEPCKAFKGLHSKCYGVIQEEHGEDILIATIAGIPARTLIGKKDSDLIYLTREEELCGITPAMKLEDPDIKCDPMKGLKNIRERFMFHINTGTYSKYLVERPRIEVINGHEIETAGGCIIQKLSEKSIKPMRGDIDYDFEEFESEVISL